ncbi:hypothetical protein EVAR_90672_1 [Eumeta japonica]|uniref:Uncharacterized protein n=1 Tax=Eumeta variegata TaxID=151549 RepID=A0A4C2ACF3_EUMVA|nr:hypothetical protein EVAR_90672_1 [Eumeta japonica]
MYPFTSSNCWGCGGRAAPARCLWKLQHKVSLDRAEEQNDYPLKVQGFRVTFVRVNPPARAASQSTAYLDVGPAAARLLLLLQHTHVHGHMRQVGGSSWVTLGA